MPYSLNFTHGWEYNFKRLDKLTKERVEEVLLVLMEHPYSGKQLIGNLKGFWSCRVGAYRIIYTIDELRKEVSVQAVGQRKNIYG